MKTVYLRKTVDEAEKLVNVLHVNRVAFLGGVERIILTLCQGMEKYGYIPSIICPQEGQLVIEASKRSIPVRAANFDRMKITFNPTSLVRYSAALVVGRRAVENEAIRSEARILHLHHPVGVLYAARAIRKLRIPAVLHVHEIGPAKPLYRLALMRASKYVDRFICVSKSSRELLDTISVHNDRIDVINNGVDSWVSRESVLEDFPLNLGAGPHIAVVGVIEPRKGQDVFLRAAFLVLKRYPSAKFWVVGDVALKDKQNFKRHLIKIVSELHLEPNVIFTGYQHEVSKWMRAMDVVVLPSIAHESFGMVLAEAQLLGTAVVASRLGGTSEVISDQETGFLVQPNNPQRLAEGIDEALKVSPAFLAHATNEAIRRFAPENFRKRVAAVYQTLAT